jgi:hypothetical protein
MRLCSYHNIAFVLLSSIILSASTRLPLTLAMQDSFLFRWLQASIGFRSAKQSATMDLTKASIAELLEGLEKGHFSTEDLVTVSYINWAMSESIMFELTITRQTYIKRIEDLNPRVHAVSQINPDAIEIARQRDDERRSGRSYGLLHGIPIVVKDLFLTTDKLESTSKSTHERKLNKTYVEASIRWLQWIT